MNIEERDNLVNECIPLAKTIACLLCTGNQKRFFDDVSSICLLKLVECIDTYNSDKGDFKNYSFCCMKNEAIRFLKKENRQERILDENLIEGELDLILLADYNIFIEEILNDEQLKLYDLRYRQKYNQKDLAELYNINQSTISRKLADIVNILKANA